MLCRNWLSGRLEYSKQDNLLDHEAFTMTKAVPFLALLVLFAEFQICNAQSQSLVGASSSETESANISFESRLKSFDENQDGLIQRSELPDSSNGNFDAWDKDSDGSLDEQEQYAICYFQKHGKLPKADNLVLEDGFYRRTGSGMTVGEFVGRALSFDNNRDGSLDKNEIIRMADAFVRLDRANQAPRRNPQRLRSRGSRSSTGNSSQGRSQPSYLSGLHSQVQLPARGQAPRVAPTVRGGGST